MSEISIQKLNDVYIKRIKEKRPEKTSLFACYLIGISELEEHKYKRVAVLFYYMKEAAYVLRKVFETCKIMDIPVKVGNRFDIKINNTMFSFIRNIDENKCGCDFIDGGYCSDYGQ